MCTQLVHASFLGASRSAGEAIQPETDSSACSATLRTLATWVVRSEQRKALRELAQEGRLLSDVGLTRDDALCEAAKPFWRR
jgi:uncharacterized protein YjiS (DUF1127 family)